MGYVRSSAKLSALIYFPQFEFRFFLEDPNQDRRLLRHVLGIELRQHFLGERLHVTATDIYDLVGVTASKRYGRGDRRASKNRPQ